MWLLDALQSVCRVPEGWKRRLRPAMVGTVRVVRAVPGGRLAERGLRRASPELHGWLARRYRYYADAQASRALAPPADPAAIAALGPQAGRVARWLDVAPGPAPGALWR